MFRKWLNRTWLHHTLLWMLSFYIVGSYFSISSYLKIIDFIYSFFFHIPLLALVYLNIRWITPNYFSYQKIYLFLLLNLLNLFFTVLLHEILFEAVIPILPIEFYIVSFIDIRVLIAIFIIYLILSTLLKLSKSWFQLERAEKERNFLELNALKSQVNPHFLFNTLNSIYSLSLSGASQTPDVVLKLSQLLKYMIYDIVEEKVSLAKEIKLISDYLDIQKVRLDESCQINFEISISDDKIMIPPLLFFPLIENSFKHGLKAVSKNSYVNLQLSNKGNYLCFIIENNKGKIDEIEEKGSHGIGLQNVRKRIDHTYGNKANINIQDLADKFIVELNLKIK